MSRGDDETAGTRRALILCGHPGDDEHRQRFAETVRSLHASLTGRCGFDADSVWLLYGGDRPKQDEDDPDVPDPRGTCTQEVIREAVGQLREQLQPHDTLWVIVMGHSHFDGRHSWFNVAGPDLHQEDFGRLFTDVHCRELVFWVTIPASGFYVRPLSGKDRIVITATEADREINETLFPHVLAEVLAVPPEKEAFDADRDGMISVFDLYVEVARRVARRYVDDNALSTEHAWLDDNGDGRGSEVQRDYLPEELGGRASESFAPKRLPNADGTRAAQVPLILR